MRLTLTRVAVVAAVAVLATACGDPDDGTDDPRPDERLAGAVTRLAEANTGHVSSQTAGADARPLSTVEGDYQLTPPAVRVTVARRGTEGASATEVIAVGRDAWSRDAVAAGPSACWVHYDVTELFDNGLLVRNGDTYFPAPIAVAALGRGVYSTDDDQVSGTSELTSVLSVADLSLPSLLGLSRTAEHRVPATFTVDDDVLLGWEVSTRDAVQQAREHADSTAAGDGRMSALATLRGSIRTEVSDIGEAVDIAAPPRDQVVDYVADPAQLAQPAGRVLRQAP